MNNTIYLPNNIIKKWEKYGKDGIFAFLNDGLEFIELFAEFKSEALAFLENRPKLMEVLTNDKKS